jgi:predicted aldo/keto reductase-like oxidoreductase
MTKGARPDREHDKLSRRNFVRVGGAALAGGAALGATPTGMVAANPPADLFPRSPDRTATIQRHHTLGRTGWEVSDIAMGTNRLRESAVVRYALDKGVNIIDTAEGYQNGETERVIGEALQHVDRSSVFIHNRMRIGADDTEDAIVDRIRGSLERLQTEYIDAYGIHGPPTIEALSHPGYHAAIATLKAEGRVRHTAVSYHGPRNDEQDSMADVLVAAAADGRFDVMLLVCNFLNHEDSDRILAACKTNNVGTTAMKTSPGVLQFDPVDPDNLTEAQEQTVQRMTSRGGTRQSALDRLQAQADRQRETYESTRPFVERYGIETQEQLRLASIHWVMQNPDMHATNVSFTDFDFVDKVIPLSGTELTPAEGQLLQELGAVLSDRYCRHGCFECAGSCPSGVPVSTIMRYSYYYEGQGYEKYAMQKYADLETADGSACDHCSAPCTGACPNGLDIQPNVLQAHALLTLG